MFSTAWYAKYRFSHPTHRFATCGGQQLQDDCICLCNCGRRPAGRNWGAAPCTPVVCCSVLRCMMHSDKLGDVMKLGRSALHSCRVAVRCSALRRVAVSSGVLWCVAV